MDASAVYNVSQSALQYTGDAKWKVRAHMSHCCRPRQINSFPFLCNVWLTNGWSVAGGGLGLADTRSQLFQRLSGASLCWHSTLAYSWLRIQSMACPLSHIVLPVTPSEPRQWTRPRGGSWKKVVLAGVTVAADADVLSWLRELKPDRQACCPARRCSLYNLAFFVLTTAWLSTVVLTKSGTAGRPASWRYVAWWGVSGCVMPLLRSRQFIAIQINWTIHIDCSGTSTCRRPRVEHRLVRSYTSTHAM